MSTIPPPVLPETTARPLLEPALVQWMAVQTLNTRYARLVDGGADADAQVDLAKLFVDLPVRTKTTSPFGPGMPSEGDAMPALLGTSAGSMSQRLGRFRWLLVGGPGSGKSTLTTMVAHVLRRSWVDRQRDALLVKQQEQWGHYCERFDAGMIDFPWKNAAGVFPIRIDLPVLSQWLASRVNIFDDSLWDYLAFRANKELGLAGIQVDMATSQWHSALTIAGPIYWILDGLDEVPDREDRVRLMAFLNATLLSKEHRHDALIVSTRPQGYGGEFKEFDDMELQRLDQAAAVAYGRRLLDACIPSGPLLEEKREQLESEFGNSDVRELLRTPLHTTMAAFLVARVGKLPKARCKLFDAYFDMVFRRELGKPFDMGIQYDDEAILRELHQRAGLTLHIRAQEGAGVTPSLRRKDVRNILEQVYMDQGHRGEKLNAAVERMLGFAMDRLVLLLHSAEGEYTFGIRSLEEYFAADELLKGAAEIVRGRLVKIALDPHWHNVILTATSRVASAADKAQQKRALLWTASLCADLNAGIIGGQAAKQCALGSRLAILMLTEITRYAGPWLTEPLWNVALELASKHQQGILDWAKTQQAQGILGEWTDTLDMHGMLGLLAIDLERTGDILAIAKEQLESTDEFAQRNGWRLLGPLLSNESPDARALVQGHLPQTAADTRAVAKALLDLGTNESWSHQFIQEHSDALTPSWGLNAYVDAEDEAPITLHFHRALIERGYIPTAGGQCHTLATDAFHFILVFVGPSDEPVWADFAAQTPETTPAWRAWKAIAQFHAHPNQQTLADALEAASEPSAFDDLQRMKPWFPWPLLACLESVYKSADLMEVAAKARAGHLGTVEDWRAAELRWQETPRITLEEIREALDSDAPWLQTIGHKGIVITHLFKVEDRDHPDSRAFNDWLSNRLNEDRPAKAVAFELFFRTLHRQSRLPRPVIAHWYAEYTNFFKNHDPSALQRLPQHPPEHLELREFLVWILGEEGVAKLDAENDDPGTVLQELFTRFKAPSAFAAFMAGLVSSPGVGVQRLSEAMNAPEHTSGAEQNLLIGPLLAHFRETIKPAFISEEEWQEYALPAPFLAAQPPQPNPAQLIRLVELNNIRLFKETPHVTTPFPIASPDHGQWIVFIGENGVGKTTLLRSLALVLAPPAIGTKLLDERYPMLANGDDGHIAIDLDSGTLKATIKREQRTEIVESNSLDMLRPWVVAYGVKRGNARGEKDRDPEIGPIGELHTLFDRPASLHNASRWLGRLEADMLRERQKASKDAPPGPRAHVWHAVVQALKELLHVDKIEVVEGGIVYVKNEAFGRVRLDMLSDGYLTTAGWAIDVIARWIERQGELDERIDEHWMKQMKGFVLIDEIDLNLHPIWQMRIIEDIRRIFPRLSFIVTTHNPLTLQGARRGEIYVMSREDKLIHFTQKDIRPGQDVDRVLFEQFGIKYTFDKTTRDLLEQHRVMIMSGVDREDPRRKEVEAHLKGRLGLIGETMGQGSQTEPLRYEQRSLTEKFRKKSQAS